MLRMYEPINDKSEKPDKNDKNAGQAAHSISEEKVTQGNDEDKKLEPKDFTYDDILINLKLIGQLKEDEKLRIYNNSIDIDNRYAQSIMRLLYGDSRDATVEFISGLVMASKMQSHKLLDQIDPSDSTTDNKDLKHKLNNLTSDLTSCLNGLDKLKITYRNDHVFRSKIEVIADRIRVIIENNMNRKISSDQSSNW